jgi:hypothetical protein
MAAAVAVAGASLVTLLVTGAPGSGGTPNANAAIVHRADAALTPPPHMIFHTVVEGRGFATENWELTSPPYSMVASKGRIDAPNPQVATSGNVVSWWVPATNTIYRQTARKPLMPFDNPLAEVRSELRAGQARVLGTATIDGRQTYEIEFGLNGQFDSHSLVAYVDRSTYRPVALSDPQPDGTVLRLKVTEFEYLPATRANLRLLSLTALHPDARVLNHDPSSSAAK